LLTQTLELFYLSKDKEDINMSNFTKENSQGNIQVGIDCI